jgi:hypothetical protein
MHHIGSGGAICVFYMFEDSHNPSAPKFGPSLLAKYNEAPSVDDINIKRIGYEKHI